MRTIWQLGFAVVLAVAATVCPSATGSALNPDDFTHYVNGESLTPQGWQAFDHGFAQLRTLPRFSVLYGSSDVHVKDDYYGTGYYGYSFCTSYNIYGRCDHMTVRLNQSLLDPLDVNYWKSTACHEMGHTVSLPHNYRTSSCMYADAGAFPFFYDSSDIAWVNAHTY